MDFATLFFIHERVGNAAPLFMGLLGALSLINYIRGLGLDGNVIGVIVVGELMMIVQVALGLILWIAGPFQAHIIHFLYGSLTILTFPAMWFYTRGEMDRRASLIWALVGLFMMGLALRAIGTSA